MVSVHIPSDIVTAPKLTAEARRVLTGVHGEHTPGFRDESRTITRTWSRIHRSGAPGRWYLTGEVMTRLGIVTVYTQGFEPGDRCSPHSRYDTVVGGRHHIRTEQVARTPLGLAIMAGKFIRELHRVRAEPAAIYPTRSIPAFLPTFRPSTWPRANGE